MAKVFAKIPPQVLEAICRAVGDISQGLSGTDINKYLQDSASGRCYHRTTNGSPYPDIANK
jgi:hypothetical protein